MGTYRTPVIGGCESKLRRVLVPGVYEIYLQMDEEGVVSIPGGFDWARVRARFDKGTSSIKAGAIFVEKIEPL